MIWKEKLAADPMYLLVDKLHGDLDKAASLLKVSPDDVARDLALKRYRWDNATFCAEQLTITDKMGRFVKLKFNKGQRTISDAIEAQRAAGKPVRIALGKARQFGGSTEFSSEIFRESVLRHNRRSLIIAHDLDSSRNLRDMTERFYRHYQLPKPAKKAESDKWWKYQHYLPNGERAESSLLIDTADELSAGHSFTIHNLHCSEIQLWRNARELIKGLFPTIPNDPDTMIFMEGTGTGVGNWWYDFYQMASDPSSGWASVFVPWYDIEDYTAPAMNSSEVEVFRGTLDDYERDLFLKGVSVPQLAWRRSTIRDAFKGIVEDFMAQYPATPDEMWSTTGRPVFPSAAVKAGIRNASDPLVVGNLRVNGKDVAFDADPHGLWQLWERPDTTKPNLYCLGADSAQGVEVIPELGNRGGDFSVAKILRRDTRTFTATLRARIDPDLFAEELYKASLFWPHIPMMIENNPGGSGNVPILRLKEKPHVVLMRNPELRKIKDGEKPEYGWRTTKESKRVMIDELIVQVRDAVFTEPSKNFWYEASTYVRDKDGLTNAQSRKFDDEVIAAALAFQADKHLPMYFVPKAEEVKIVTRSMDTPEARALRRRPGGAMSQREAMEATYVN